MADSVIADHPPHDDRQWDCQCARCGSSMDQQDCEDCGGEGVAGHDCGEDACCCLDPDDNCTCNMCGGAGSWLICLSSAEWCKQHPLPGREKIERGQIEWYALSQAKEG